MNVDSIRDGIVTRLATITGLRTFPRVPPSIAPPCAFVASPTIVFDIDMSGGCRVEFPVMLMVSRADDRSGQETLDDYIATSGTKSVRAAMDGDLDLSSSVDTMRVVGVQDYGATFSIGGNDYIGCQFNVECLVS